ncbi:hypothetical protein [Streptomyces sp. HNM0574]|uniref:hypothetical protein n=1 Tax=Streptomyces sp. HNM0574 TaxID=2714954 RepID=UPI00146C21EC|nr:hypothetical protein [Streptomyces sp. HNM0574]NLU68056.1 hypothetical protein [Streptomyces sp. HNM0574]
MQQQLASAPRAWTLGYRHGARVEPEGAQYTTLGGEGNAVRLLQQVLGQGPERSLVEGAVGLLLGLGVLVQHAPLDEQRGPVQPMYP